MTDTPWTPPPPTADVPAAFASVLMDRFAARANERFTLVLSGGPTARACYEALAEEAGGAVDWALVDVYVGDERYVPADDPDANQGLIRQALLDRVAPVGTFSPMDTSRPIDDCAADYARTIGAVLAGGGIDLIHLGMGPDGHTASLFPGAPTLGAGPGTLVLATEDPNGRNPHPRLTLTLPVIDQARLALFTVTGAAKQEAVAGLARGDDLPAAHVAAAEITWLIDADALGAT